MPQPRLTTRRRRALATLGLCCAACGVSPVWSWQAGATSVGTPWPHEDLVAVGHSGGVSLLNAQGALRCTFAAAGPVSAQPRSAGPLLVFGSRSQLVYAIDRDCRPAWRAVAGAPVTAPVAVADGRVLLAGRDGTLEALAAATGARLWRFPAAPPAPPSAQASGHGGRHEAASRQRLAQRRHADQILSSLPFPVLTQAPPPGGFIGPPAVADGTVYVANADGAVYALGLADGALRWRLEIGAPLRHPLAVGAHHVYVAAGDGTLIAIDRQSHAQAWRSPPGEPVVQAPVCDGPDLLAVTATTLHRLQAADGRSLWQVPLRAPPRGPPDSAVGRVAVTLQDGSARLFRARDEAVSLDIDGVPGVGLGVGQLVAKRFVVPMGDGSLRCFDVSDQPAP